MWDDNSEGFGERRLSGPLSGPVESRKVGEAIT